MTLIEQAESYQRQHNIYKMLFRVFCNLCDQDIDILQEACFKKATTQIRPNHEVTLELMEVAYKNMFNKIMDYSQVMQSLKV